MVWWIGAVLALLISVAWVAYLSTAVSRGEEWTRKAVGMAPAYAFHAVFGLVGLWLIMRAVA